METMLERKAQYTRLAASTAEPRAKHERAEAEREKTEEKRAEARYHERRAAKEARREGRTADAAEQEAKEMNAQTPTPENARREKTATRRAERARRRERETEERRQAGERSDGREPTPTNARKMNMKKKKQSIIDIHIRKYEMIVTYEDGSKLEVEMPMKIEEVIEIIETDLKDEIKGGYPVRKVELMINPS